MRADYRRYFLKFKIPGGTSRGVMTQKETFFLSIRENGNFGIGECGLLRGLSTDDVPDYEDAIKWVCQHIGMGKEKLLEELEDYPSIQFGLEQAFLSFSADDPFLMFQSPFTLESMPIPINGLVWMGSEDFMWEQIERLLASGFNCIKMKIGAIDFDTEIGLLKRIRRRFSAGEVEIRVDANGAFKKAEVLDKLEILANLELHSIEQPIAPGDWEAMKNLCASSPLPIALDEELIGIRGVKSKRDLLEKIKPRYLILKPSLLGGIAACEEWISCAEEEKVGWWITSALESNIGLNAIAQWTASLNTGMHQGLGTGSLFENNFESPLRIQDGKLYYGGGGNWDHKLIEELCT